MKLLSSMHLDEYREKEIKEMESILKNKKLLSRMSE